MEVQLMSFDEKIGIPVLPGKRARVVIKSFISRVSVWSRVIPLSLLLVASIMVAPRATGADQDQNNDLDGDRHDIWLRIAAFTDIPLAGADVAVYDKAGRLLYEKLGATNNRGVFPARVKRLPRQFRVVVTWDPSQQSDPDRIVLGKLRLSDDVQNFDPSHGIVYVNPVTTIVSRLLERDPTLTDQNAEALTRQFLALPSNASLGTALREGTYFRSAYFSQSAFLSQASQYGGVDTFIDALVNDIIAQPLETHPFPVALSSSSQGPASFIATNLASGALHYVGGQGAGWIMAQTGLVTPGATTTNIDALVNGLSDLTSSIESLSNEVAELTQLVKATANQTQYVIITTTAQQYATQIQGHESDLYFWAQYCPPLAADTTPPTTTDPYCSDTNKSIVTSELQTEYENKYYEQVEGFVQDNGTLGTSGILHLYSLWLGESKPFFRPADSTKMQNLYNYWDTILTAAANLRMEYFHYLNYQDPNSPAGNAKITDFMGNPDLSPPTTGTFQANETANLKLTFPAVPAGTVIFTKDHTMWATDYPVNSYNACSILYGGPPNYSITNSPALSSISWNGIAGWASPSLAELQSLISGWDGSDPNSWLTAQTQAVAPDSPLSPGFANFVVNYYNFCGSTVWTSTPTGSSSNGYPLYYLFSLYNGAGNNFGEAGNPHNAYLLFLKRSLSQGEQYYWYQ